MSFVNYRSFKTNKIIILFCRELVSRSRNLNQHKSKSLLETKRHFNVEVGIYYFCQFTILTPFLSCWLINLGVFLTGKKVITNFLNPLNIYRQWKKKKKWIRGVSFVDLRSFKTNKRIILFCRELVSRSRNIN